MAVVFPNRGSVVSVNGKRGIVELRPEDIPGLAEAIDVSTKVILYQILKRDLVSEDKAGVANYLTTNGFVKNKGETVIFDVVEFYDSVLLILTPENNQEFEINRVESTFEISADFIKFDVAEAIVTEDSKEVKIEFHIE